MINSIRSIRIDVYDLTKLIITISKKLHKLYLFKLVRTVYTKPTKSREAKSRGGVIGDNWKWVDNDEDNFNKL